MNFELSEARAILERTPALLDTWLRDMPDAWLDCDEGPDTWTPRQVVGHLIHGEHTDWIPRVRHLLEHGERVPFERFDRGAHLREGPRPIDDLLDEFAAARYESLAALDHLSAELEPERAGMHPDLGPVTLAQLLATWAAHDLAHILQIARTMARRYREDVGPWAQYLSVMR